MGRYVCLHHNRVHSDDVKKNCPEGLRNRTSCDHAGPAGEGRAEAEEAEYRHVGGGSGRLGAAVQRAMAMRERQSTQAGDVKGIGAMRHLYNSHNAPSTPSPAEINWSAEEKEEARKRNMVLSPLAVIGSQSMRYSRFLPPSPNADEDQHGRLNNSLDLGNNMTGRSLPQSHQISEPCNSVPVPHRSEDAPTQDKGFLRKLFRLHKKTTSTSWFRSS